MAKRGRGGLGRGLDSLIPDRVSQRKKTEPKKESKKIPEGNDLGQQIADDIRRSTEELSDAKDFSENNEKIENKEQQNAKEALRESEKTAADLIMEDVSDSDSKETRTEKNDTPGYEKSEPVVKLRISLVEPKRDQPRKYFDDQAIDELADSIGQYGIISPLLVQKKDNYYEIIAGERRWRAAKKAGLKEVPVIIKNISDREAVEISLIENIQREDLNPMEESRAYERLVKEYGLSQEEVAQKVSRSRSAVTNSMRLLKLQPSVQKMVEEGSLSEGHARTIVSIEDPILQKEVAEQVIESNLSVRQTETLVKSLQKSDKVPHKKARDIQKETLLQDLADHLKNKLGTKVSIRPRGKNKGRIEIEYYSDEELDRIYELLQSVRQEG